VVKLVSLRQRKFIGELTKKQLIRNGIIAGAVIAILLVVWFGYPAVLATFLGGGRGGYDTQIPIPTKQYPYEQNPIPFTLNLSINPDKFNPKDLPQDLADLFNPSDLTLPSNFMNFNASDYNIPLFYIQDVNGYSPGIQYMKQSSYDTFSADGTQWSRSSSTVFPFVQAQNVVGTQSAYREVKISLNIINELSMRLPFFPYTPKYISGSLRLTDVVGGTNPTTLPDSNAFFLDDYSDVVSQSSIPSGITQANLTYDIVNDPSKSPTWVSDIKDGIIPTVAPSGNLPANMTPFLQIPSTSLGAYLSANANFSTAYNNILVQNYGLSGSSTPSNQICNDIFSYLTTNYDQFTTFPQQPANGQNMVDWFLGRPNSIPAYKNAGGTSYDFAAAFTMLARSFGVPARLVVGYLDWDHDDIIELMNLYAWSEVYISTGYQTGYWVVYDFPMSLSSIPSGWAGAQQVADYNASSLVITSPTENQQVSMVGPGQEPFAVDLETLLNLTTPPGLIYWTLSNASGVVQTSSLPGINGVSIGSMNITSPGAYQLQASTSVEVNGTAVPLVSQVRNFTVTFGSDYITIINPWEGRYFGRTTGLPLTLDTGPAFNTALYNYYLDIDGAGNVSITSQPDFPFNVSSLGAHFVQAYMTTTSGVTLATSAIVHFTVAPETGYIQITAPLNGAVINADQTGFTVVAKNATPVIGNTLYYTIDNSSLIPVSYYFVNATTTGTLLPGLHALQFFMRTEASDPGYLSSNVVQFTLHYETGQLVIIKPVSTPAYSSWTSIPLTYSIRTPNTIQSVTYSLTGAGLAGPINITGLGNITFAVSANGTYYLTLHVTTNMGSLVATTNFTVFQTTQISATSNGQTVLNAAVNDTTSITLLAHVQTAVGLNLPGVSVTFTDMTDNSVFGTVATNSSGLATLVLASATLQTLSTGAQKVQAASSIPAASTFTYFAIDRPLTLTITGLAPGGPNYNLARYWNTTLPGNLTTAVCSLKDSSNNPIAGGVIALNIDAGTGGANLSKTSSTTFTDASGSFTWLGYIGSGVTQGLHTIVASFQGQILDGNTFTFSSNPTASRAINVTVQTSLSVHFTPHTVDVFQDITISGLLTYDNGTAFSAATVSVTIQYLIGGSWTTAATLTPVNVVNGTYTISYEVLSGSQEIRVQARYAGTSLVLSSTAQEVG
jgi:hypothetical protein